MLMCSKYGRHKGWKTKIVILKKVNKHTHIHTLATVGCNKQDEWVSELCRA